MKPSLGNMDFFLVALYALVNRGNKLSFKSFVITEWFYENFKLYSKLLYQRLRLFQTLDKTDKAKFMIIFDKCLLQSKFNLKLCFYINIESFS